MKPFFCILLLLFQIKPDNTKLVNDFVLALRSDSRNEKIIQDFLSLTKVDSSKEKEQREVVDIQLNSLRDSIKNKKVSIVPYLKSKNRKILIEKNKERFLYILETNGSMITPILVQDNRIVSIFSMNKGKLRVILEL